MATHYRVKFFSDKRLSMLEESINNFLRKMAAEGCELHDIKYFETSVYVEEEGHFYDGQTAMVIYKWDDNNGIPNL